MEKMQEPINPIKILKDGKEYPPHLFECIQPPFVFISRDIYIQIDEGETPFYFKRKRNKGRLNLRTGITELELIAIKYRIGKVTREGLEISYWIDINGQEIKEEV